MDKDIKKSNSNELLPSIHGDTHPLIAITVIVALSLIIATVLFGILSSTGILKNQYFEFGGAATAFFVAFWGLKQWYDKMESRRLVTLKIRNEIDVLTNENNKLLEILKKMRGPMEGQFVGEPKIDHVLDELQQLHSQYNTVLPTSDILPTLRKLFVRNSFGEKVEDCIAEDWITRLRVVRLTEKVLQAYSPSISKFGTRTQQASYESLVGEVRAFSQNLTGLFAHPFPLSDIDELLTDPESLKKYLPTALSRDKIEKQVKKRCNTNMEKISKQWEAMGLPATFDGNVKSSS